METEVRKIIEQTEIEYEKCFDMLCALKKEDHLAIQKLFSDFQPTLANAIFNIEAKRIDVINNEKGLIRNKERIGKSEFIEKIKKLAKYKEALQRTFYIGKSLGDAFAFFFYFNDRELLNKHLAKPENNIPISIGGRGEVEFITKTRQVGSQFLLYHGITNILRIGDFSLFDAKDWTISGLAELKTQHKEKGVLNITFSALGKKDKMKIPLIANEQNKDAVKPHQLDDFVLKKLKRQMETIGDTFVEDKKKVSENRKIYSTYLPTALEECLANSAHALYNYVKADSGLIMMRIPFQGNSLHERLFIEEKLDSEKFDPLITSLAKSILNSEGYHNNFEVSTILYSPQGKPRLQLGITPLFWHTISPALLKQIYFQEVGVITIFNPSFLMSKLAEHGFVYYSAISDKKIRLGKFMRDSETAWVIENFGFFKQLVKTFLQSEESIVQLFNSLPISENFDPSKPQRFNIDILQHFLGFDPFKNFTKSEN